MGNTAGGGEAEWPPEHSSFWGPGKSGAKADKDGSGQFVVGKGQIYPQENERWEFVCDAIGHARPGPEVWAA